MKPQTQCLASLFSCAFFVLLDVKPNYLKGLSHVLNRLPKPVLLPELPTVSPVVTPQPGRGLFPWLGLIESQTIMCIPFSIASQLLSLLLEALSCPDSVVQLSTLSCLQPLLLEAPQVMSLHVDTLVTKFLNLSSNHSMVR